ncbi:MAG: hypothetical protein F6J96_32880 [Symploca sp. SIO1C2]|nr:hypothetical protein [Symploca sp. SIO1C2]
MKLSSEGRRQKAEGRRQEAVSMKKFHHQVMKVASSEVACCLLPVAYSLFPTFKSEGKKACVISLVDYFCDAVVNF